MNNDTPQIEETTPPFAAPQKRRVWGGVFPTTIDLLAILGLFFFAQLISVIVTTLMGYSVDYTAMQSSNEAIAQIAQRQAGVFSLVSYSIVILTTIIGALIIKKIRGGSAPIARFSLKGFNPTILLWGVVMVICVSIILDPLMQLLPPPPPLMARGWAMILALVVVAPITEELLCRGIILESIKSKSGVWRGCIVSSIFFAILHLNITASINALAIGFVLSFIYVRTKSLFAPIILHAFNNALAYLLVWMGYQDLSLWDMVHENKILYIIIYSSCAVLLIASIVKIIHFLHTTQKQQPLTAESKN